MKRNKFKFWHSLIGTALFLTLEGLLMWLFGSAGNIALICILVFSFMGVTANIIISMDVIEEVRNARYMVLLLSVVVFGFVIFFAFQYWYLLQLQPHSFPGLDTNPINLLLHSTMVFVFNPIYLPASIGARSLMLIETYGALALALFILQNMWQFRKEV
ncbi:MAG: hypothetical protein JO026_00745 [Patescibacteria group bacterium]|nr:hypothetical protein [Patescibacteria group bacterium]